MDINLTGQIWGMGSHLTGELTQPWFLTYSSILSPVLAASLSAIFVFLVTRHFNNEEHKNAINQQRQQAYSQLTARKDIVARFNKLFADALFEASLKKAIKATAGTSSDPMMNKDYERIIRRCDKLSLDVNVHYRDLLETLTLVQKIFSNKDDQLNTKVNNIIIKNNEFIKLINIGCGKYELYAALKIAALPYIREPYPHYEGLQINSVAIELRNSAENELIDLSNKYLQWPVDELLKYLDSELKQGGTKPKSWWRFWR
ncbi:MAG: hypothetical protein STSR0001_26410 [Methanothrix sp.]|jgi:phosphate/sulfate permease|nr:hypothetical protein [Sphaerochaetaceae bacterium]